MPQLIFKGLKVTEVQQLSQSLLPQLVEISQTPKDHFMFEHYTGGELYLEGRRAQPYPLVEVILFARPQQMQDELAAAISKQILALGYPFCEIFFTHLKKENYYEFEQETSASISS